MRIAKTIRCGDCGKAYIGVRRKRVDWSKTKKSSYCLSRYVSSGQVNQGAYGCDSFHNDQEFLEGAVIQMIKREFANPKRLAEIEARIRDRINETECKRNGMEVRYHDRSNEILLVIERYFDAIATGLNPEVCKIKIEELNLHRAVLEGESQDKETGVGWLGSSRTI